MLLSSVRALAVSAVVCLVVVALYAQVAQAQEDNPFGARIKAAPAGENPFAADAPAEPAGGDPFAAESPEPRRIAATNPPERPEQTKVARPASSNERVRETLESPTRMEFVDTPLLDAVNFLRDLHGIEIQLDMRALEHAGVGSDTPMSRTLNGLPLKSALRLLLSDVDLAYVVQNDVLLITTKEKASEMREVRVYDVTKLVSSDAKADEIAQMLVMLLSEAPQQSGGGIMPPPGLQTIRIVPLRDLLVIRASQDEHDEITTVLQELAKALPDKD